MRNKSADILAGIFVIVGILCIGYLAIKMGKMEVMGTDGYTVYARFNSIAGLRSGADIEIAGVRVGRVASISLDQTRDMALVALRINGNVELYEDSFASVRTSGLIGDKYILLSPGGSGEPLKNGDEVPDTESALDIESMIGKFIFGKV
jgi:phospholipid/cholesterol/gamma-HCH transport system substrate-binding protein